MFTLDQDKVERLVVQGLREELNSAMRHQWGTGQKLRNIVDTTIAAHEAEIAAQVKKAVIAAINSEAFMQMARDVMLHSMSNKFAGAFDGVMRAAGKRAAQDALLVEQVVKAATAV